MTKETIHLFITHYSADGLDPLSALLRSLFGNQEIYAEPGSRALQPAPGVIVQLCNAGAYPPAYLAEAPQPVIHLPVGDLDAAVQAAQNLAAVLLNPQRDDCTGFTICHLRLPDQKVIGFFSTKAVTTT